MQIIAALLLAIGLFLSTSAQAQDCPPQGNGGDTTLNRLKNRTELPGSFIHMKVEGFIASTPAVDIHPKRMDLFSQGDRGKLDSVNRFSVTLEGYLVAAGQGDLESANCRLETKRGIRLWIAPGQPPAGNPRAVKAMQARSVMAETNAYWLKEHGDTWQPNFIQQFVKDRAKVRVSGWVLYNPEHPEQIGKTKGTAWEISPATKIEIWSGDSWREL